MSREATQESLRTLRCHQHRLEELNRQVRTRVPCELTMWHRHHRPKSCLVRCNPNLLLLPRLTNQKFLKLPTSTQEEFHPSRQTQELPKAELWFQLDQRQQLLLLRPGLRRCCNLPNELEHQGQPKFQLVRQFELSCGVSRRCEHPLVAG